MKFTKMHGIGNDYVYVNCFEEKLPCSVEELAQRVSNRHFGIGSDGLVLILPSEKADVRMRMFNPDGSESEMCGNAIRCVAKYVYEHHLCRKPVLTVETGAGCKTLRLFFADCSNCSNDINSPDNKNCSESGLSTESLTLEKVVRICVDMGEPILLPEKVPTLLQASDGDKTQPVIAVPLTVPALGTTFSATAVSMGNPHCILFVNENELSEVLNWGPEIEVCSEFPRKVNVELVNVLSRQEVRMRVWERGTGETLACGTGACAVAVASILNGKTDRKLTVHLTGGDLEIEWNPEDNHVYMTGSATEVFSGELFL